MKSGRSSRRVCTRKKRKWAAPFVIISAGLFILGGLFAYFVAFKLGLAFLIGIGISGNAQAVISLSNYLDLFTNVSLGMGLVFELPVLIFFLSLLRIVTPGFLVRNSRYAILGIVVVAALITPTPDVNEPDAAGAADDAAVFHGHFRGLSADAEPGEQEVSVADPVPDRGGLRGGVCGRGCTGR
ncbi:MAG: twin-arginine translocase subunit TatC [Bryobacterales bacterium]|nr:twin-arginine translocase subunit TatC [Bryobacterales bacterium]